MELLSFHFLHSDPIKFCTSAPSVTEDELKLMLRVAELSGAIEEEEQVRTNSRHVYLSTFANSCDIDPFICLILT